MFFIECPYCGSNLDFGERCDCQDREPPDDPPQIRESRKTIEPVRFIYDTRKRREVRV